MQSQKTYSVPNILIHLGFTVLLFVALVHYKERMYADSGWYFFQLVNTETFRIENHRLILGVSQLLPYLGIQLNLSLKTAALLYSANHVILPWAIASVSIHYFANRRVALGILLIQIIGISVGFFTPMYEMYYVFSLLFLVYLLLHSGRCRMQWFIFPLLIIILSSHLLAYPLLAILLWQLYAVEKRQIDSILILCVVLMMGGFILKQLYVTEYDKGKTEAFFNTLQNAQFGLSYLLGLMTYLAHHYWDFLLGFLGLALLPSRLSFFHRCVYVASIVLLLGVVNVAEYGFHHTRYHEQVYSPILFALLFPFCINVSIRNYYFNYALIGLILLFASRIVIIYTSGEMNRMRVLEIEENIARARSSGMDKIVVDADQLSYPTNWSYPPESLILSSLDSPQASISIITKEDLAFKENKDQLDSAKYMARKWEIKPTESLNERYFHLSTNPYLPL